MKNNLLTLILLSTASMSLTRGDSSRAEGNTSHTTPTTLSNDMSTNNTNNSMPMNSTMLNNMNSNNMPTNSTMPNNMNNNNMPTNSTMPNNMNNNNMPTNSTMPNNMNNNNIPNNNITNTTSFSTNVMEDEAAAEYNIATDTAQLVNSILPNNLKAPFTLPPLDYAYNALEPYIDERTMRIHHDKHHQTYVNNLNKAILRYPELSNYTLAQILTYSDRLPSDIQSAVINNGGGHYNHSFFWKAIGPNAGGRPTGALGDAINRQYGTYDNFKRAFKEAALSVFGSGWTWLALSPSGRLEILSTDNQNTLLPTGFIPITAIDVWEHAYYLKHQNMRDAYIDDWFNVVNWNEANRIFSAVR